jgi:cation:H+ antiporter
MGTFGIAYAIAVGVALLPADLTWPKLVAAAALLVIYALYVKRHFEADPEVDASDLAPLFFRRLDPTPHHRESAVPRLRMVNLQVLAALALIVFGAVEFVGAVEHVAHSLGVDEVLLSLVIAPIATELPEKFNSIIWIRQGKDTLALGNITGAMVFQSCIPTIVALVLAPGAWVAGPGTYVAFASAGIAFLSSAAIFIPMARTGRLRGRWLLIGGAFYVIYLAIVLVAILRPAG